jgi:hypothetical protein
LERALLIQVVPSLHDAGIKYRIKRVKLPCSIDREGAWMGDKKAQKLKRELCGSPSLAATATNSGTLPSFG